MPARGTLAAAHTRVQAMSEAEVAKALWAAVEQTVSNSTTPITHPAWHPLLVGQRITEAPESWMRKAGRQLLWGP